MAISREPQLETRKSLLIGPGGVDASANGITHYPAAGAAKVVQETLHAAPYIFRDDKLTVTIDLTNCED